MRPKHAIALILIIILIVIVSMFFGCTKKIYIERTKIDSIYIQKLDTSWLQMPADTTFIELPIDCTDQQVIVKEGKKETKIVFKDRIMTIQQTTKADSILIANLRSELKTAKENIKIDEKIAKIVPFWAYILIISMGTIICLLVYIKWFR